MDVGGGGRNGRGSDCDCNINLKLYPTTKTQHITSTNLTDNTMSIGIELAIYGLYGLLSVLAGVPFDNVFLSFLGSACTVFLVKALAAGAGSASGAKLSKTIVSVSFWIKVGIGFVLSLALSPSVFDYLSPSRPWLDIHAIYFLLGSLGVVSLRILTKFFGGIETKADDLGEAVGEKALDNVKSKRKDGADK